MRRQGLCVQELPRQFAFPLSEALVEVLFALDEINAGLYVLVEYVAYVSRDIRQSAGLIEIFTHPERPWLSVDGIRYPLFILVGVITRDPADADFVDATRSEEVCVHDPGPFIIISSACRRDVESTHVST